MRSFSLITQWRTSLRFVTAALVAASLASLDASAQSPGGTGSIAGRVTQSATRKALELATVSLAGTKRTTTTDADGEFHFANVAPGDYRLSATYTGLDDAEETVAVSAGSESRVEVRMTSDIYRLGEFVVAGEREGSAKAVQDQRYAANLKTVISADQFGGVADGSLDDALKRLPGIGYSNGELSIRGTPDSVSAIEINGVRLASASGGADTPVGEDRSVKTNRLPGNSVESIEVIKALTPDKSADSIGGTVNLITKSAFVSRQRQVNFSAGFMKLGTLSNPARTGQVYSLSYSDTRDAFRGHENLGVFLTVGYSDIDVPIDRPFRANEQVFFQNSTVSNVPTYLNGIRVSADVNPRKRYNAGARFDYKLGENSVVSLDLGFNHEALLVNSERDRIYPTNTTSSIQVQQNGVFVPLSAATTVGTLYNWTVTTSLENLRQMQTSNGLNSALSGIHTWGAWKLTWNGTFSQDLGTFDQSHTGGDLRINLASTTVLRADVSQPAHPLLTVTGGVTPAWSSVANAATSSPFTVQDKKSKAYIGGSMFNLKRDVSFLDGSYVQAGGSWREEWRINNQYANLTYNYLGGSDFTRFTGSFVANPFGWYPDRKLGSNPTFALQDLQANPANWRLTTTADSALAGNEQNDGTTREDVYSTYAMGVSKWRGFTLLAGVRDEYTTDTATGTLTDNALPIPAKYAGRFTKTSNYSKVFPSAHLKYNIAPNVQARVSYSTGIGRPGFNNLRPQTTINETALTISQNNPGLKPQYTENTDATIEWYFRPSGALSVGVFRKNIFDYIRSSTTVLGSDGGAFGPTYAGYAFTTSSNIGGARIDGYEIDYRQQFTFLPGYLRGLGAFANMTHLNAQTQTTDAITQLATFIPKSYNFGVTYILGRVSFRALGFSRSNYLLQYNADPYQSFWRERSLEWDFKGAIRVTKYLNVYCDVSNAFEKAPLNYTGPGFNPYRVAYENRRPRRIDFGAKLVW